MRRTVVAGLSAVVLLVAGGALALLRTPDRAPLPSHDRLRINGFAVWPEDTLAEGMEACESAEPWRLDPKETAFQFAHEVLNYPSPTVTVKIEPWPPDTRKPTPTVRYLVNTGGIKGVFLGSAIDVSKYDRCWFVVGVEPREDGFPATVWFVHPSGEPHLAIESIGQRTQVGYGSWERSFTGGEQVLYDLSDIEPNATGHVITLGCFRRVCDASGRPLGFIPEPATMIVDDVGLQEVMRTPGVCRSGAFPRRFRALASLYAMAVQKPTATSYGKPKIGKVRVTSEPQLRRLGIRPLGSRQWSFTLARSGTVLHARVIRLERCWRVLAIDDPDRDLMKSLSVGRDLLTFDLRWGRATSAIFSIGSKWGGDSWEIDRSSGPITVTEFDPRPLREPFWVTVSLWAGRTLLSEEATWHRAR